MALTFRRGSLVLAVTVAVACARAPGHQPHFLPIVESPIALPPGFAAPPTPRDNPLTIAKAELGRYLFYDRRLSLNETQSCASCHQQKFGFCDGRPHATGSTGQQHRRNTMSLANVAYRQPLTWSNPKVTTLEQQVLVPLTNHDPIELGMDGHFEELLARIRGDSRYVSLFSSAFPDQNAPITIDNVARALASFERTLISAQSPYDRLVLYGDSNALSASAWRGRRLFFSQRLGCGSCHGRSDVVSLRNVAITAPYMRDGSAPTLSDAIDHSRKKITAEEKRDLIAFLESLTDDSFLSDPRYSNPW
ncbi:MAG: di-heme enzyme [Acidobacteria bacterium]|nr:MAG: di-heme enzyme [Acidobacteriota bacterium]